MSVNFFKSGVAKIKFYSINFIEEFILYVGKIAGRIIFPFLLTIKTKKNVTNESYFSECKRKSKCKIFFEQHFYILLTGEIINNNFLFGYDRDLLQSKI